MYVTSSEHCFLLVESQEIMSAQVFSLEQVCQERAGWYHPHKARTRQKLSAHEAASVVATHHQLHEVLRRLVTVLTLSLPLDELLQALTALMVQALDVDLCIVLLREHDTLHSFTCTPDLSDKGVILQPVRVSDALWEQMRAAVQQGQMPDLNEIELEQLNPLQNVQYQMLLPIPLIAGNICSGLLLCYSSRTWHCSDDDELMLCTIAMQVALAVQHRRSLEEDLQEQRGLIRAFIHDLCEGDADREEALRRRAYSLGYDLSKPHVVALIEFSDIEKPGEHKEVRPIEESLALYEDLSSQFGRLLQERYPGSLVATRNDLLLCLLPLDGMQDTEQLYAWCNSLVGQMRREQATRMYVGIGNPCQTVCEYRRGYAEAQESLEVGRDIHSQGGCSHFDALGAYRYLYAFAHADTLRDQYQEQIAIIVEYDRRKKTNLLDTLEIYLECGGNIAKTSSHLDVHRNTLLQRLDRIQKLCPLDLEHLQIRFPLLVALKVHRLRTHHSA
jgi:sugar diacid utilization regulator